MIEIPADATTKVAPARARRPAAVALVAMAVAVATQSAPAQIASGRSGSSTTMVVEDDGEAWRTLVAFGTCYAARSTASAFALIATEPGSREEAQTYRQLFSRDNQSCLGGNTELRMPLAMVRGAIAEGLYERGVALPANLVQAAPQAGSIRTLSEAARCYAAAHRDRVHALAADTRAGSRGEHEALSVVAPDFFRCVPETARGRQFDPTLIRYRLIEAALRMPPSAADGALNAETTE